MKILKRILIVLFLAIIMIPNAFADDIYGSIKGSYVYDGTPFTNTKVYLYKIATVNTQEVYTYLDNYTNFELDINTLNSSEWPNYADALKKYINNNGITYNDLIETSTNGDYEFKNLSQGLYLLLFEEVNKNGNNYTSSPTLISIPNRDDITNELTYDITVNNKIEEEIVKPTEPTTEATTTKAVPIEVPQTSDNIMIYIILFIVSLIILLIIGIYIFKLKKENEVNEKNEEIQ